MTMAGFTDNVSCHANSHASALLIKKSEVDVCHDSHDQQDDNRAYKAARYFLNDDEPHHDGHQDKYVI